MTEKHVKTIAGIAFLLAGAAFLIAAATGEQMIFWALAGLNLALGAFFLAMARSDRGRSGPRPGR